MHIYTYTCMYTRIYIIHTDIYNPNYSLLSLYDVICTYVFRADHLVLANQLACPFLSLPRSLSAELTVVLCEWGKSPEVHSLLSALWQNLFPSQEISFFLSESDLGAGDGVQLVERLSSMHEVLGFGPQY